LGMAQLLRETQLDQEQNEYARTLYNSGQAMLRLVNDILDLSKLDAGKMQTEQLDFDLLELSIEVCDLMAASAAQKSLELVSFIDPDSPRFLQGDPYRIRQILLNLINNAIKFTSIGYVALHVRPIAADDPVIVALGPLLRQDDDADVDVSHADLHAAHERAPLQEVDAPVDHQWVMFEVSDSGVGIAPENQQALFQFFAQADRTVSRRFGGTGLGLAISRGLAEAMNGCITLSSEPNQGTVFRVYLPLVKQSEVPMYHRPILLANLAVEVFEPLDLNRQGLSRLFQSLSIHAEMHDDLSGLAIAAERTSSQHPILLIDYELLDDRPLADYLSRYPELRQAHCILLSRRSRRSIPARMIEGFEGFVFKPLRVEHLLAELLRMLDGDDQALDEPPQENQQALMDAFFAQVKQTPTTAMQTGQLSLRVLLAEDNIVNQKVASKMLQKLGCEVTVVEDGQQAVDFLMGNQPVDLVLMDCRMPNMDGLEATRLVRRQMNSIPIIALTANDTDEDREACMNAGMDDFLAKPLDQSVLSNLIARFRLLRQ
jgi:CheY-like chemotaxis protein